MKSRIFSLLFAVLGLVSCEFLGTLPDAPQPTPDGPDSSLLLSDEAAFLKAKENPDTEPSNRFVIDSLWVEADAIKVQVSYGGGCQAHHSSLSMPVAAAPIRPSFPWGLTTSSSSATRPTKTAARPTSPRCSACP
ncbi:MAG: hypothetical protein HC842_01680 [Cytophagales bacterium]|nr:hypothetical protein [Cytophagales bacterium]